VLCPTPGTELEKIAGQLRNLFYAASLPWSEGNLGRVITKQDFPDFYGEYEALRKTFYAATVHSGCRNQIWTRGENSMNNSISIQQRDSHSTHDAQEDIRNRDIAIYINGDMVHRDEAKVSVYDSGFMLGDGMWEGMRLYHGKWVFFEEQPSGYQRTPLVGGFFKGDGYENVFIVFQDDIVQLCQFRDNAKDEFDWADDYSWQETEE
jgi:hypothetical protein